MRSGSYGAATTSPVPDATAFASVSSTAVADATPVRRRPGSLAFGPPTRSFGRRTWFGLTGRGRHVDEQLVGDPSPLPARRSSMNRLVLVLALACAALAGAVAVLVISEGGDSAVTRLASDPATTTVAITPVVARPRDRRPPARLVRLSVRALHDTADKTVTVRGRTTRGARVTVRGERAVVEKGMFHARLSLRMGTNRFTVV